MSFLILPPSGKNFFLWNQILFVFLHREINNNIMEDLVLTVPVSDYGIIEALAARMGWGVRTRRTSIDRFIASCPQTPQMTDEEIAAEVNAVRYGK